MSCLCYIHSEGFWGRILRIILYEDYFQPLFHESLRPSYLAHTSDFYDRKVEKIHISYHQKWTLLHTYISFPLLYVSLSLLVFFSSISFCLPQHISICISLSFSVLLFDEKNFKVTQWVCLASLDKKTNGSIGFLVVNLDFIMAGFFVDQRRIINKTKTSGNKWSQ